MQPGTDSCMFKTVKIYEKMGSVQCLFGVNYWVDVVIDQKQCNMEHSLQICWVFINNAQFVKKPMNVCETF